MFNHSASPHVTTLGMFIIDEIHHGPSTSRTVESNILGGAGTYAILGARIFSPSPNLSKTLHWIVDAGSDFPDSCREQLERLDTSLHIRTDLTRKTTRGWNSYPAEDATEGDDEHREFKYLAPKKRLSVEDLMETGIGSPRCIHLICSPQRCIDEVFKLSALPKQTWGGEELDTIIVWEPVPDLCTPENREAMLQAAMMVDVVSPNHEELLGFFADEKLGENAVEGLANRIQVGNHGQGHMVVRAGKKGCYVRAGKSTDFMVTTNGLKKWLPAYHEVVEGKKSESVVDPTGGGNTFIGGMCQALARGIEIDRAAAMGNVAASFAIEQIGLPVLQVTDDGELWNGEQVKDRMEKYLWRIEGKKA